MSHTDQQPQEQPDEDEQPGPGRIRWLPFRVNGILICQINEADPTHLRIVQRRYGQHFVAEFNTKSVVLSALTGQ